jgi:hypothetical protein
MPAETDARAKEHGDNSTKAAGSQLRWVHPPMARSSLTAVTLKWQAPASLRFARRTPVTNPAPFGLAGVERRVLVITPLVTPLMMRPQIAIVFTMT